MAIHLGAGGNSAITIGGQFNPQVFPLPDNWVNPTSGLTALQVAITLKPDRPIAGGQQIFHQNDNAFVLDYVGGQVRFTVIDQTTNFMVNRRRIRTDSLHALRAGRWNRIVAKWRAADHQMSLWINSVDEPVTVDLIEGAVRALTVTPPGQAWAIEIGAESAADLEAVYGAYAEAALWGAYGLDLDAVKYGQGYSPERLATPGRIAYHDLRDPGTPWTTTFLDPGRAGTTRNRWTGVSYGAGQPQPFGGIFQTFAMAPHPIVCTEEPVYVPPMLEDRPSLPQRWFSHEELLGHPGWFSGVTHRVPSEKGFQQALNDALPGDVVALDPRVLQVGSFRLPTKTTLRPGTPRIPVGPFAPDARPPVVTERPPYILVTTEAEAQLPPSRLRQILLPDGTSSVVLEGSARITTHHRPALARVRMQGGPVLNSDENSPSHPVGWMFRGIRFENDPATADVGYMMVLVGARDNNWPGTFHNGARPTRAERILFDRCEWDADPEGTGRSVTQVLYHEGDFIGVLNSRILNFYGVGTSETKLFQSLSDGWGPVHIANSELQTFTAAIFTGGGGTRSVGVVQQDLVLERTWQWCPYPWRRSECNPFDTATRQGTQVTVDPDGVTVRFVAGAWWTWMDASIEGVHDGCVMVEPATGRARRVLTPGPSDGPHGEFTRLTLEASWGATAPGPITVYFQTPAPTVAYNSGLDTPMPTATTTAGSRDVVLSHPIPPQVHAGLHYFYGNNTHWSGGSDQQTPPFHTDALNTGFGWMYGPGGIARADCKRKQIVAIAPDRMTCVLEGPYFESRTGPYSAVLFDGLWRSLLNKGSWETKIGNRFLDQGNVREFGSGGTQHPTNQLAAWYSVGRMRIVGDQMTVLSGGPIYDFIVGFVAARTRFGARGPYALVGLSSEFGRSREILAVAPDRMAATLTPIDPAFSYQIGDVEDVAFDLFAIESPWTECSDHLHRYNLTVSWLRGISTYSGIVNISEHVKGQRFLHHDEVCVRLGDLAVNQGGSTQLALSMGTGRTGRELINGGPDGPITNDNGTIRYSHQTHVHCVPWRGWSSIFTVDRVDGDVDVKATDIELCDSIWTGLDRGHVSLLAIASGSEADPHRVWGEPVRVARNILAGQDAPAAVAHPMVAGRFPDNVGLVHPAMIGFRDYEGADPFDLSHYVLDDLFTAGTVTLAPDGLSATLDVGVFPWFIAPGQFFRTRTHPRLQRITAGGAGTSRVAWTGAPHPEAGQAGRAYAITFKGTGTDGRDPGADLALVEAFTRDVRQYEENLEEGEAAPVPAPLPAPPPTPTPTPGPTPGPGGGSMLAIYDGVSDKNLVGPSHVAEPGGGPDLHIGLAGLRAAPSRVEIASLHGYYVAPGDWGWAIAVRPVAGDPTRVDCYIEPVAPPETAGPFTVTVTYPDGTTETATTTATPLPGPAPDTTRPAAPALPRLIAITWED